MDDLTALQRDLLYVTAADDQRPTPAIRADLDEYYPTDVADGELYPSLQTLVEQGLLEKGAHDERTDWYALTEHGRDELASHREWKYQYVG